ncbi:MAG: hypothetical protein O2856_17260, partial [Planctomycetota bacterium]|nr:hypothetical protein [Planctomycetota bacterium]
WYQGRRFKATVYSVCIFTIFIWGMILGGGQPVYSQLIYRSDGPAPTAQLQASPLRMKFSYGYVAQVIVGVPALPSLIQEMRMRNTDAKIDWIDSPINSDFQGMLSRGFGGRTSEIVTGTIELEPANGNGSSVVTGTLHAVFTDGTKQDLPLAGEIKLGRKVFGAPRREVRCGVLGLDEEGQEVRFELEGSVRRSFVDWFQAPRDTLELDRLNGELSQNFDIGSVFTWIAGLLNLMAIWDAAEGPAYGYGDEEEVPDDDDKKLPKKSA